MSAPGGRVRHLVRARCRAAAFRIPNHGRQVPSQTAEMNRALQTRSLVGSVAVGLIGQVVLVASGVVAARMLGPVDRGWLAGATLATFALGQVGLLGVPTAITYFAANSQLGPRDVRAVGRLLLGQVGALSVIQILVLGMMLPSSAAGALGGSIIALPGLIFFLYGMAGLQGRGRFRQYQAIRLVPAVGYSAGLLALWAAGRATLTSVALAQGCAWLGAGILAFVVWRWIEQENAAPAHGLRTIVGLGVRGMPSSLSPVESFSLDQMLVGAMFGARELGFYVVAAAFSNLPRFVGQSIGIVAYPEVTRHRDPEVQRAAAVKYVVLSIGACALVSVPVMAAMNQLIVLLFGEEYGQAAPIAQVLLLAGIALGVRRTLTDVMRGMGRPGLASVSEIIICLAFPALTFATANGHDVVGVAWALAVTVAGVTVSLAVAALRPRRGVNSASETPTPADEGHVGAKSDGRL